MDALPVREKTQLQYASKKYTKDGRGKRTHMHACGHDLHTPALMGAATLLSKENSDWSSTLMCLYQIDEETGQGAQAMVDDDLYKVIPVPDIILGQHVDNRKAGNVAVCPSTFMASAD